jgi:FkbH-like protein
MKITDFGTLFSDNTTRLELLSLEQDKDITTELKMNVWRNTSFEVFSPLIDVFLAQYGIKIRSQLSGYDSTFDVRTRAKDSKLDLILVELQDISQKLLLSILKIRITELQNLNSKKVIIVLLGDLDPEHQSSFLSEISSHSKDVLFLNIGKHSSNSINANFFDTRLKTISGSSVSPKWHVKVGREIAYSAIYKAVMPQLKIMAIDFDNTLIDGVIGEDEHNDIGVNQYQRKTYEVLKAAKDSGIITALVSRNVESDIKEFLEKRRDLGIKVDDFDFFFCSWEPKENLIEKLLSTTRVAANSCIFVDDNPTELISARVRFPSLRTLLAHSDEVTVNALNSLIVNQLTPGRPIENLLRVEDLIANQKRDSIFESHSKIESEEILKPHLDFVHVNNDNLNRAFELSHKTNQFNLTQKRFTFGEIETLAGDNQKELVMAHLKDALSDSGLISLIVFESIASNEIKVLEFDVSCRAIGRGLENRIFKESIIYGLNSSTPDDSQVFIDFNPGERNQPALDWLKKNFEEYDVDRFRCTLSSL